MDRRDFITLLGSLAVPNVMSSLSGKCAGFSQTPANCLAKSFFSEEFGRRACILSDIQGRYAAARVCRGA